MKSLALLLGVLFALSGGSVFASEQEFRRIYQPVVNSDGDVEVSGKWREIPAAKADSPRTWVAPFLRTSQLMPECSLTSQAGLRVTSVMGVMSPVITIHVSSKSKLASGITRTEVLQRMIESIQLNMKESAFFNVRLSFDRGVNEEGYVQFEGSYTIMKSRSAA